jgi:mannosyl-3-phosphoglycerate phosphatase
LTEAFQRTKATGAFDMVGFCEMTTAEIARLTGLSVEAARLAARREYSEPFICRENEEGRRRLEAMFRRQGLRVTRGGRFFHLTGNNDKGRAVAYLTRAYAHGAPGGEVVTIGLGDSANDIPMLRGVDKPVIIRKKTGQWEPFADSGEVYFSRESGPRGWAEAVAALCFAL